MLDDLDRDCCASVEKLIRAGIGRQTSWEVKSRVFRDPGMDFVLCQSGPHANREITVGVRVTWNPKETRT